MNYLKDESFDFVRRTASKFDEKKLVISFSGGKDSCGMLLSAIHYVDGEERLNLVMLDDAIPAGAKLY